MKNLAAVLSNALAITPGRVAYLYFILFIRRCQVRMVSIPVRDDPLQFRGQVCHELCPADCDGERLQAKDCRKVPNDPRNYPIIPAYRDLDRR